MQRLHERKADILTLGGLRAINRLAQKSAEAVVGRKRAISPDGQRWKTHSQTEGPNVRMAKMNKTFMNEEQTTENTSETCLCEDKPEAESKTREELKLIMQPMGMTPG